MGTHPDLIKALVADRQEQLARSARHRHRSRHRSRGAGRGRPRAPVRRRNALARHLGGLLIYLGRRLAPETRRQGAGTG